MNNYYKIIIGLAVVLFGGTALWFYYGPYSRISAAALEERKVKIVDYTRSRVGKLVAFEDFNSNDALKQDQAFKTFFESIQTPEIFRIKVFSRDPKIIWSNLKELIGQDASTNQDVKDALVNGKVTIKFKSVKPEQITERQFRKFTETYIPIANEKGAYIGVIEIYQTSSSFDRQIRSIFLSFAAKVLLVVLAIYIVLALVIRRLMPSPTI